MTKVWKRGGLSWKKLAQRVWTKTRQDDVFGRSAELAYYFLLALIPLLLFLTSMIGLMIGSGTALRSTLFEYLSKVLPGSAFALVDSTMSEISTASSGGKVVVGLLAALWAASNGMGAITQSLNIAFDVKETRPWWKQRLVAIGLTVGLSILIVAALLLVLYGGNFAQHLAQAFGLGSYFLETWPYAQWPIALAFMLLAFSLVYYLAPDVRGQRWIWITPGSVVGVVIWLLVSLGFRIYLHFFNSYTRTYGSLGAVIVLMLWLYLTGTAILIGGETNALIEEAAAKSEGGAALEKNNNRKVQE